LHSNAIHTDLLNVPGIGPKTERRLVECGLDSVDKLKKVFVEQQKETQIMMEFLKTKIGVRNSGHARSIATFLSENLKEAQRGNRAPPRLTFCIEGNISVGKTTFLQRIASECEALQGVVDVVPEPVDKWQNVVGKTKDGKPTSFNLLDEFYRAPERYAYTFQNFVFYTRFLQEQTTRHEPSPLRLMERSVFSDRMVFCESLAEANWMNEMEMSVYDSWFDHVIGTNEQLIPSGFIYLRAQPNTCHERLNGRGRKEEAGVSLEYLSQLHDKHEKWFRPEQMGSRLLDNTGRDLLTPKGVIVPAGVGRDATLQLNADLTSIGRMGFKEPPEIIRDRVVWMDSSVHKALKRVPALILDCDPSIDMDLDVEAKKEYAEQVRAFFDYVRELMELEALDLPSSSLVLPGDSEVQMDHLLEVTANLPPHLRTELMEHLSKGVVQAEVLRTRSGFGEQYNVLRKFVHAQAGDMSILDAAVNEVQQLLDCLDKQKRHVMYIRLAQACGWRTREKLPEEVMNAVRAMYPDEDGKYTGFKEA